jgi:hypothetical protein
MILSWFKRRPSGQDQLKDFVDRLSQAQAEDLGLAVATVEHTANAHCIFGDFYQPFELMRNRPEMLGRGVSEGQRLQASGLEVLATGWIAWVHTFRAVQDANLIPLAKSMWTLLIRGAPYAPSHKAALLPVIGFELRVEEPARVPEGFD